MVGDGKRVEMVLLFGAAGAKPVGDRFGSWHLGEEVKVGRDACRRHVDVTTGNARTVAGQSRIQHPEDA